ncbi:MAG TPA: N,N-dimethylformamidase beta subunit family domain-containing protein, partial [Acidimicrobiales bacterium]|nr:N,N-dimethylformamidase beta subunit family domain-containing protein [Acidimicrobiales bacterium]
MVAAAVVGVAVGAVALLVPSARTAGSGGGRGAGPALPVADDGPGRAAWVIEENRKPGSADWHLSGPLSRGDIEGYADATSVNRGQRVRLFVSTTAATYRVHAYRIGWYGGSQGRLVWTSEVLPGVRQPSATVDPTTNMAEARWAASLSVDVDRSWPPGNYLFKLVGDNGYSQYVPLTVRDDSSRAVLLVVNAVTTWQAYNRWGGHSLYEGIDRFGNATASARAQVVSFDRPYENDSGSGDYLGNELPMVSLLEKEGYDVAYWTDIDLHSRVDQLANHKALLTLGHDEYWTKEMRDGVEAARDRGMNLAFFGANAVFRAIRLDPSELGPHRRQVNYRVASADPLYGVDDSRVTVSWREPPLDRPESTLIGAFYQCNPVKADFVVADASAWVFAGSGLRTGDRIPDLVGPEYDRYDVNAPAPPGPVQVLAHSPVRCGGRASYSDMTYYSTRSGAGVLATGTNWWISRLDPACPPAEGCFDERVAHVTRNILDV